MSVAIPKGNSKNPMTWGNRWPPIVAKKKDSAYVSGERGDWLKLKFQKSDDFVIGGYIGLGSVDELIVGQYRDGKLMFVEAVKAGFNPTRRRDVFNEIKHLKTDQCPFVNLPEKKAPHAMDREKMRERSEENTS